MQIETKNLLITGTSGFIGRNLKEYFTEQRANRGILWKVYAPSHRELDLLNINNVKSYLDEKKIDVIIHAANTNRYVHKETSQYDELDQNLRMYINLANCREKYSKMFYFGSGAEYDMEAYVPFMKENYRGSSIPKEPYGFAKYIMAEMTDNYDNIYELCLFGVFGKYEEWKRRFVSNIIQHALKENKIVIQKHCYFDYLWIDDLCEIIDWFLLQEPCYKHYNVCTGQHMDLYDIAKIVRTCLIERGLVNQECQIEVQEEGWKCEYSGNNDRLMKELGSYRFTSMQESVNRMIDCFAPHFLVE